MKIAVNARLLIPSRRDGIARFTRETMKRITRRHPEHEFLFLFDRKYAVEFIYAENIIPKVVYPQARHPILYKIWFDMRLPQVLKRTRADIFLSSDGFIPLNSSIPTISVIHDINYEHYPQFLPKKDLRYYKKKFPMYAQQATHICTVSEFSKQDLVKTYNIHPDKITVVYNGISDGFQALTTAEKSRVRNRFTDGKAYIVYAGSLHGRKNIARMFRAFNKFKQKYHAEYSLVVVGEKQWWTDEMQAAYQERLDSDDIILLGQCTEDELNKLVAAADAMIYVPLFEGFGIPPLEAMQCQVPVLVSDIGAINEVVGDAAIRVDPLDIEAMSEGIHTVLDQSNRKALINRGLERVQLYSWDRTSSLLWGAVEKIIQ